MLGYWRSSAGWPCPRWRPARCARLPWPPRWSWATARPGAPPPLRPWPQARWAPSFQLTDSVRHVVEKDPVLRLDEITAFGHGTLDFTLRGPSDTTVFVQVRVTTGAKETTTVVEARLAATYKRLDAAACWAVARVVEERVAQALRAETADGGAAR